MKILHVASGYYPENTGGTEAYLRDLVAAQRAQGHAVELVAGSHRAWQRAGIERTEVDGGTVYRVHRDDWYSDLHSKSWHPGVSALVRELIAERRPDMVHVHQWLRLSSDLVEIAESLGVPAVVTLHDLYTSCPRCFRVRPGDEACFRPLAVASCLRCVPRYGHEDDLELAEGIELFHAQYQSELHRARAVLVATRATADLIAASTGFPRDRFEVLPLAYAPRWPDGAPPPAPRPGPGEPFRFGYWGNLTHRKGTQILVAAFAELLRARGAGAAPVELHLFGKVDTDALDQELRAASQGLPVTFHGRFGYDQLAAAKLHFAVFPIICFETFAFVLDECFELRLPCLVTAIGAMPERAGGAALVVPPRDVGALAQALAHVLAEPKLCDELRARIPPLAPRPAVHAAALQQVYERALAMPPRTGGPRVELARRQALLVRQRESALGRITPEGGPR